MTTGTPTPDTTLAILLGASQWPHCKLVGDDDKWTPFATSANDVHAYITNADFLGIPEGNVCDLFDSLLDPEAMLEEIEEFVERRTDEIEREGGTVADLIVYYIGHGGFANKDNDFYLAIHNTKESAPFMSSLPIEQLAQAVLKHARFMRRYLILDCCFAARAFEAFQSDPGVVAVEAVKSNFPRDDAAAEEDGVPTVGTALLCASSAERPARVDRSLSHTMFTWGLLNALKSGEPKGPRKISIQDLCTLIAKRISKEFPGKDVRPELHMPDQRQGSVASVPLFPNKGLAGFGARPAVPRDDIDPDPQPLPVVERRPVGPEKQSRWAGFGRAIDQFVTDNSPMTIGGLAVILGASVIFLSSLLGIDMVQMLSRGAGSAQEWTCGVGKRVGLWTAPNWSLVYLLLFPVYLFQISSLARHVRKMIDESILNGAIIDEHGRVARKADVHRMLSREVGANGRMFAMLGAGFCALALIGWWTSVGGAIFRFKVHNEVVDWSTAVVACGWGTSQWWSFIYTLVAYLWVGFALFGYFAYLFLGVIYAFFLQRLAAGDVPSARLMFRRKMTTGHLRDFFLAYFIACVFGFLAAYCMRLQAAYVGTADLTFLSYWLGDLPGLGTAPPPCEAVRQPACIQPETVTNQTFITAGFVAIVTLVALLATTWQLQGAFRDSKKYLLTGLTESRRGALRAARDYTPQEIEQIERTEFLASVVPHYAIYAVIVLGLFLAVALAIRGLSVPLIALSAGAAWLVSVLIRRWAPGPTGAP